MKTGTMTRPGLVLDLMDQLREASEELGRLMREEDELYANKSRLKTPPANDLLVVAGVSCAATVFGDVQAAHEWLTQECQALDFVRPLDLLEDCDGLSRVLAVLVRIQKNVYT